jgi:hypothetical protein
MDVKLARQYHTRLSELLSQLRVAKSVLERAPIAERMLNINSPLHIVHTGAAQHIEEALRGLKYPDTPMVNASLATLERQLSVLADVINSHREPHFTLLGRERFFARPVQGDELRSAVERGRLIHERHEPYLLAFEVTPAVESTLLKIEPETLLPVLERMGFGRPEALLVFRTKAVPRVVAPVESIPSLRVAKLRSGVPVTILKHRVL